MLRVFACTVWLCAGLLVQAQPGALPGAAPDTLGPLLVVGKSRERVLAILKKPPQPFSFAAFLERHIDQFVGAPYGSGGKGARAGITLVNLETVDCVTLIEYFWAMALTSQEQLNRKKYNTDDQLFARFIYHLKHIRYYGGQNKTWEDRIHFFTDALAIQAQKGRLTDVGVTSGGVLFDKEICYMTQNRKTYPGIANWNRVIDQEITLSNYKRYYFPLEDLYSYEQIAQTGDIVGLTTDIHALDISHCGFIHKGADGVLRISHASYRAKKTISRQDFCQYLTTRQTITGVVVFRPTF